MRSWAFVVRVRACERGDRVGEGGVRQARHVRSVRLCVLRRTQRRAGTHMRVSARCRHQPRGRLGRACQVVHSHAHFPAAARAQRTARCCAGPGRGRAAPARPRHRPTQPALPAGGGPRGSAPGFCPPRPRSAQRVPGCFRAPHRRVRHCRAATTESARGTQAQAPGGGPVRWGAELPPRPPSARDAPRGLALLVRRWGRNNTSHVAGNIISSRNRCFSSGVFQRALISLPGRCEGTTDRGPEGELEADAEAPWARSGTKSLWCAPARPPTQPRPARLLLARHGSAGGDGPDGVRRKHALRARAPAKSPAHDSACGHGPGIDSGMGVSPAVS